MRKIIRDLFKTFISILAVICLLMILDKSTTIKVDATEQDVVNNIALIDDGIKNWTHTSSSLSPANQVGKIPIGGNNYLCYTFGSARDSNNNVLTGGDTTITKNSTAGTDYQYNSKINVFLNQNGNYYGILHQAANSYIGTGGYPERTSDTSLDFAFVNGISALSGTNYGILPKLTYKVFYKGTDANNNPVYKIGGYLSNQRLYAEILLRPSLSGAPIVQRELYLYNPTTESAKSKFQIYYGEDTSIDATGSPAVDDVPLYSMGNDEGLYLYSAKNPATSDAKLYVTNDVKDGFSAYMGKAYSSSINWDSKGKADINAGGAITSPSLKYSGGTTTVDADSFGDNGRLAGSNLLYGIRNGVTYPVVDENHKQNSAYTLRWPMKDKMQPGETLHYASNIGATLAGYSIPNVKKTYTNTTPHSDGLNHLGDKLRFTLTVQNDGLRSSWNFKQIQDAMPTGLTIDPNSASYKWTEMTTSGTGNNQVDTEVTKGSGDIPSSYLLDNKLNFTPNTNITEKGKYYITFDATINSKASGTLTNTANFTGANVTYADGDKSYKASVDIPVAASNFKPDFSNQLRNVSNNDSTFNSTATGEAGNIIEFKSILTSTGSDAMKTGNYVNSVINDNPSNLKLVSGSVSVNGVPQPDSVGTGLSVTGPSATVIFRAEIIGKTQTSISNTALMNNVTTNSGDTYTNLISDPAVLNITEKQPTTSFVEVPSSIDFGSINSSGSERMLLNKKTEGNLIINHSNNSPFQVSVSYDNDINPIKSGDNKLVDDNGTVLFFKQATSDGSTKWTPLSTTAVPIKSDGFDGSYENFSISQYVGLNKWELRVPGTAKSGKYTGQITWSIQDTPQN